jgi:signal transduction histidine kinase
MWIGSNTEITEMVRTRETLAERRRELERLVDERTASLRKAVEQMEEFSYSISHDLRAPLRAMQGYAQALLEDYGARLDDEGTDYLRRIIAASSRMDRLTLDVLTYSKVSREDLRPQRVSLGRLVTDCVRQHIDFRDGGADIAIEHPLPDVLGHEPLIMQVVSNLIGNALKFVAPGTTPRVRIRSDSDPRSVRLWIEDNGIGVPPRYQKRIWGMFERAHQGGGYAGTGIGLAIVRKAVERMGGQVGVESDGSSGSRFWVRLPSAGHEAPAAAESESCPVQAQAR